MSEKRTLRINKITDTDGIVHFYVFEQFPELYLSLKLPPHGHFYGKFMGVPLARFRYKVDAETFISLNSYYYVSNPDSSEPI